MSKEVNEVKEQLGVFASKFAPDSIVHATVKAVNENDSTIEAEFEGGLVLDDVRLRSVVKAGNKCIMVPEVDSIVLVGRIEGSEEWVVLAVESISKVLYVIGTAKIELTEDGLLVQKGSNTLKASLVKFIEAVEQIVVMQGNNPDYVKLTQAKTEFQNLLQ
jgi:hypothetical protein